MNTNKHRDGFTLVELAIVLVIIGLLVGGVLVGQDLIKAATIRSTVSDIEKVNTAATTFRTKYSGLPGDLLNTRAVEYQVSGQTATNAAGRDGTAGKGDGNGLIEGCAANTTAVGCETALFWADLSSASLIAARLNTFLSTMTYPTPTPTTTATVATFLPKQKLRDSAMLSVYPSSGKNWFYLGSMSALSASGVPTLAAGVTPGEARSIDEKFDDAAAGTGVVTSASLTTYGTTDTYQAAASSSSCINGNVTPQVYNVIDANINNVNCSLLLRANF